MQFFRRASDRALVVCTIRVMMEEVKAQHFERRRLALRIAPRTLHTQVTKATLASRFQAGMTLALLEVRGWSISRRGRVHLLSSDVPAEKTAANRDRLLRRLRARLVRSDQPRTRWQSCSRGELMNDDHSRGHRGYASGETARLIVSRPHRFRPCCAVRDVRSLTPFTDPSS